MDNYKLILGTLILFVFYSCSSIKVTDVWKSENFEKIKDNKILVIARTDNTQARTAFESQITKELNKNGIQAESSFSVFPTNIKMKKELTEGEKILFEEFLKNEGYNGVVLSVIKDVQEVTKTVTDGGYYAGASIPRYYPGYFNGFFSYYYNPLNYYTAGTYVEPTSTTYSSKTFVVETVVYDLSKSDEQLIAVITSEIDNPSNMSENAKLYTKKVAKALK